jgi:hypothetical protein
MRISKSILVTLAVGLPLAAQIAAPTAGLAGRPGRGSVEVQGQPGAWVAVPVSVGEPVDAAASSARERCWVRDGQLTIQAKRDGATQRFAVGTGSALFAFDSNGALAAVLSQDTREVFSAAARWAAVYALPEGAEPLDVTSAGDGTLNLLYRTRRMVLRTRIEASTGRVWPAVALPNRPGPALLGDDGHAVFASGSGLEAVQSMQRLDHGWMLLSTARAMWMWQPGHAPQAVPMDTTTAPVIQLWPFNTSKDVGSSVVFPETAPGNVAQLQFLIVNTGVTDLDISSLHLSSAAPFRLYDRPSVPWHLAAGKFATLGIQFAPTAAGVFGATLTINDREIGISGSASGNATSLQPILLLDPLQPGSNQTVQVRVKLDRLAPVDVTGLVSASFTPAFALVTDDPAIQLTGNRQTTRSQPFTVTAGTDTAVFGADQFLTLYTGTTAGVIRIDASTGSQSIAMVLTIEPAAPVITSATRKTTTNGIVLTLLGFDNTRSLSTLNFTFYTSSGSVVSPGVIGADLTHEFLKYFVDNSQVGGNFQLTATFPVSGDIASIASASVDFKNSSGVTTAKP